MKKNSSNLKIILYGILLQIFFSFIPTVFAQTAGMHEVMSNNAFSSKKPNTYDSFSGMMSMFAPNDPYKLNFEVLPEMNKIINISKKFFSKLILKNNIDIAVKSLFAIFPISDKNKINLKTDIKNLQNKIGPMIEAEYLGYRTIGKLKRYFTIYFVSYHMLMPVVWEFTFYKPISKGKWQLNYIRFNSDNIYEFLKYPRLKFNLMKKTIKK